LALHRLGIAREHILIVGDTVDTDIAAGLAAGIRTALVLTGNTKHAPAGERRPTVTVPNLSALRERLALDSQGAE
jgi:4-nitrophenyl phosphatase